MQFFKKHPTDSSLPQPTVEETITQSATMEEIARSWWAKHLGGNIPEDIERWLKDLAQTEARRLMLSSVQLSDKQKEQAHETIRLGQARMQHISEQVSRIKRQQEWLHNYERVLQTQKEHNTKLYEINKRITAAIDDEKRLERFETFEPIQGDFQHISHLRQMGAANREAQSALAYEIKQASAQYEALSKEQERRQAEFAETEKRMELANEQAEQLCRILGAQGVLEICKRNTGLEEENLRGQVASLKMKAKELRQETIQIDKKIAEKQLKLQALDPHHRMLSRAAELVLRLNLLSATNIEINMATQRVEACKAKQREEDMVLAQVFQQYQHVIAEIKEIRNEIQRNHASMAGSTSYALQERAMQEKTRHQMLLAAHATWNQIRKGYSDIEESRERMTGLTHRVSHGRETLERLREEVDRLQADCRDKEYTLTVSKSASVIQLRSDLREGVSCTVCGAAHHPYHSDTMLEQNKLISELKTEFQLREQELQNKRKLLHQLEHEQASNEARLSECEHFLVFLNAQQKTLVQQWQMYAHLDRSFADCSPSTNMDARTEMLRLLTQTTQRASEQALQELEKYNSHQARINILSTELGKKEQERANLDTRLSEVNTACHVLARQVEMYEEMREDVQKRYSRLYEEIQKIITLHEWQQTWTENAEALCQRISTMANDWRQLHKEMDADKAVRQTIEAQSGLTQEHIALVEARLQQGTVNMEQYQQMMAENQRAYDLLMENQKGENFHKDHYQALRQGFSELVSQSKELGKSAVTLSSLEGQQTTLARAGEEIDQQLAKLRYTLDLWIRRYNTQHPPVQYEELENTFASMPDWEGIRKRIRENHIQAAAEKIMVDHLNTEIMQMQSFASHNSTNIHNLSAAKMQQELEQLHTDYMQAATQTARQQLALERDTEIQQAAMQEQQKLVDMGARR